MYLQNKRAKGEQVNPIVIPIILLNATYRRVGKREEPAFR